MTTQTTDNTDEIIMYETLNDYPNYEIATSYPFIVRNKTTKHVLKETVYNYNGDDGYPRIKIGDKVIRKHLLIARQFIPNDDPEHLTQVDHINHNRADYHIENLRWVSRSDNQRNRSSHRGIQYEFIDELPNDYIDIDTYETKNGISEFNEKEYYYSPSTDKFYYFNGQQYRILIVGNARGALNVQMRDKNKRRVTVYYTQFKVQYDLLD